MTNWKTKLTSRKLWVAVTDFIGMLLVAFGVAQDTVTQVIAIVMAGAGLLAYIIAEGLVDAKATVPVVLDKIIVDEDEGADPDGNE